MLFNACAYEPASIKKIPRETEQQQKGPQKQLSSIKEPPRKIAHGGLKVHKNTQLQSNKIKISLASFKNSLIGLSSTEIRKLLGKPSFQRQEKPASIWQYQSKLCLADIFFYTEKSGLIVDYVETRSKTVQKVDNKACFSSILVDAKPQ